MKVILVVVSSLDGKITKGTLPPQAWASLEDQDFFFTVFKTNNLFLMGSKTYLSAQKTIKPNPKKLKIVLTRNPKNFSKFHIPNRLEFSNEPIKTLVKRLEDQGFKQLILLGGASVYTEFFKAKLINELWLTLEPLVFGQGKNLLNQRLDVKLNLKSLEELNDQGTLLLKYKVL